MIKIRLNALKEDIQSTKEPQLNLFTKRIIKIEMNTLTVLHRIGQTRI